MESKRMTKYIAAIDQGTTSTRCIVFDKRGRPVTQAQQEHEQIYPRPGWVEHDPLEIWHATDQVIRRALEQLPDSGAAVAAVGVTNQRETTVIWDRITGQPLANAIVWQDTRTKEICDRLAAEGGLDRFRPMTGLPLATYFSGPKLTWLLENLDGLRAAGESGRALFGTVDSWLIWQLTGGPQGGVHITDVTNASRTMMMDLASLDWDAKVLEALHIPRQMLPQIHPSSVRTPWGMTAVDGPFGSRIPVCGALGDQQAALAGQACFSQGEAKNTYGTGCFLLLNTGERIVPSQHGLITTVAYQFGSQPAIYALEGSIAIAGALVQWLRDNLGLIASASEVETLARSVDDNGGVYFVPAFSGLFAPYWRSDARGVIVGLTRFANRGHLARAALEATAYQVREVVEAMREDSGVNLSTLKADGGMVHNELLMQFQSDLLDVPVIRPAVTETTALGAAFAAGLSVGYWKNLDDLRELWSADKTWQPQLDAGLRGALYGDWKRAVQRSFDWVQE
jgi:glycerol kinase